MQTRLRFRLAVTATALALLPLCAAPASAQDPARIPTISDLAEDLAVQKSCLEILKRGLRPIAEDRTKRFQGKVTRAAAICRGGMKGLAGADTPWVDWPNYWGARDKSSLSTKAEPAALLPQKSVLRHLLDRNKRGSLDLASLEAIWTTVLAKVRDRKHKREDTDSRVGAPLPADGR